MLGIFLDTETNGLNWREHSVLELAFTIIDLKSGKILYEYSAVLKLTLEEWKRGNPVSLAFTDIPWAEVEKGRSVTEVKSDLLRIFKNLKIVRGKAVFICQNPSFDRIFFGSILSPEEQEAIQLPYIWLDLASMFFAKEGQRELIERGGVELSKDKIAAYYNLPPETRPHRAPRGVSHLIECYRAVVGFPLLARS